MNLFKIVEFRLIVIFDESMKDFRFIVKISYIRLIRLFSLDSSSHSIKIIKAFIFVK